MYDGGSCLYPQLAVQDVLKKEEEIDKRIFLYPTSAYKQTGGDNTFSCPGSEGILPDYAERVSDEMFGTFFLPILRWAAAKKPAEIICKITLRAELQPFTDFLHIFLCCAK